MIFLYEKKQNYFRNKVETELENEIVFGNRQVS